jgi:CubicO group peptidase (beta-lactamase class C family)
MNKKSFKQLLLLWLITLFTGITNASNRTALELQIEQTIADEELVGIVWSTVSNDTVMMGSTGFANKSKNILMSPSQKMHVGSVTKTVLALGTLRLITEGKLTLNTKITTLLPNIALQNPWHNISPVSVKNLLEHTAGLDNIRMWQFLNTTPTPVTPLKNAFPLNNHRLLKVRTQPGKQYSYSNMSYTLLAMVIEAVTQEKYEDYLDKNFLQPLNMSNSTFKFTSQTGQFSDEKLAMGYFENNVPQTAVPSFLRPAGQFTTTAPDMAKFMQLIFNNGVLNNKPFIRSDLIQRLGYPDKTDAENAGLKIGHGLALAMRDRHGVVGMCHPGTTLGFRAYICLFPKEKKSFFYAINTDSETADYEKFNAIFINYLLIDKSPVAPTSDQKMNLSALEGIYLPSPNNMAEFEWLDLVFNFKWLTRQDNKIVIKSLQNDDKILLPLNKNLLRATDRTQASHAIIKNNNKELSISSGLHTYKQQPAYIIIFYWLNLILGLFGLTYIICMSIYRTLIKRTISNNAIIWPFLNILAFSIPVFLYTKQSFLYFGELTTASFLLAVFSGLLPISLLFSLYLIFLGKLKNKWKKWDSLALLMLLQLCLVLIYWHVIPVIFWQ